MVGLFASPLPAPSPLPYGSEPTTFRRDVYCRGVYCRNLFRVACGMHAVEEFLSLCPVQLQGHAFAVDQDEGAIQ
jgi:hypothetical protein